MNAIQSALACRRRSTWIRQASSSVGGTDRSLHCGIRMVNAAPRPRKPVGVAHCTRCKRRRCSESIQNPLNHAKPTDLIGIWSVIFGSNSSPEEPDRVIHERDDYRMSVSRQHLADRPPVRELTVITNGIRRRFVTLRDEPGLDRPRSVPPTGNAGHSGPPRRREIPLPRIETDLVRRGRGTWPAAGRALVRRGDVTGRPGLRGRLVGSGSRSGPVRPARRSRARARPGTAPSDLRS